MAFKKMTDKLPPRLWMLTARSGDGKSHFSMQMQCPILPIDADRKIIGAKQYAVGDVYEFSANHADALNVERIAAILDSNMPGSDVATITIDSVTPILEPIIVEAMEKAQSSKNKIAPFKAKADAIKKLTHALHKWGTDVLWIYHIEDSIDTSGNRTQRTSIPATELARIAKSVNMRLSIVRDGERRGIRVDYAQHGKYGMTIWDDVGGWKGMPERIEKAVYADGVLSAPADPTTFANPADAVAWGFAQNCFRDAVHCKNAYDKVKEEHKPDSAAKMWALWVADVKRRMVEVTQENEVESELVMGMKIVTLICNVCHQPIIGTGCAPHMTHVLDDDSANNVHYHAECCPDCKAEEETTEDELWQAFLLNELHALNAERLGL